MEDYFYEDDWGEYRDWEYDEYRSDIIDEQYINDGDMEEYEQIHEEKDQEEECEHPHVISIDDDEICQDPESEIYEDPDDDMYEEVQDIDNDFMDEFYIESYEDNDYDSYDEDLEMEMMLEDQNYWEEDYIDSQEIEINNALINYQEFGIYDRKMETTEIRIGVNSNCDKKLHQIIKVFEDSKDENWEVVLLALGNAMETLQYIVKKVHELGTFYQYNCLPTQKEDDKRKDMIIIALEVKLSKVQPSEVFFNSQPRLDTILFMWRKLIKNIRHIKGKYYSVKERKNFKDKKRSKAPKQITFEEDKNLPDTDPKSKNQQWGASKLNYNDSCPVCLDEFTKTEMEQINSYKPSKKQKDGIKSLDFAQEDNELYKKIYQARDDFFTQMEGYYYHLPGTNQNKGEYSAELQGEGVCVIVKCKHVFHKKCLKQWVDSNKTCPVCRVKISNKSTFNDFFQNDPVFSSPVIVSFSDSF